MSRRERILPRGWYPVDRKECQKEIKSFVTGWSPPPALSGASLGGIIPHAGWYFSGKLAARVMCALKSAKEVDVVVLYGGHMGPQEPPRFVMDEACETPLGDLTVDLDLTGDLMKRVDGKKESSSSGDNTIEIQLAMVKYFFPHARLIAVRSPHSLKAVALGQEIAKISQEKKISILALGSTDLTHYGPNYGFITKGVGASAVEWVKKENDKGFIDEAIKMDAEGLLKHAAEHDSACSAGAAAAAVSTCKALGSEKGLLVDYYTSYDIMPDASFVGYAGIVY
jgi:AmmeMemoRadiSam system protein B